MKILPITTGLLTMSQTNQIDKGLKTSTIAMKPQSYDWTSPTPSQNPGPNLIQTGVRTALNLTTNIMKSQSYGWTRPNPSPTPRPNPSPTPRPNPSPNPSPTPSPTVPAETKEAANNNNKIVYIVGGLSSFLVITLLIAVFKDKLKTCFTGSEKELAAKPIQVAQSEIMGDIESGKIPMAMVVGTAPALTDGTNEAPNAPNKI